MSKKFDWNPVSKIVTIYENGEYSIGPPDCEIALLIKVGENPDDKHISEEKPGEPK